MERQYAYWVFWIESSELLFGSFFSLLRTYAAFMDWLGFAIPFPTLFPDLDVAYVYFGVGKRAVPWDTMRVLLSAFWDEAPGEIIVTY